MLNLTDDATVNALILDVVTEGEMYGEDWEHYKAHIDSTPPMSDEEYEDMRTNCPF